MPPRRREQAQPGAAAESAAPERPTTPVSSVTSNLAAASLEATPKSKGSGSYTASGGFTDARVRHVYPWIARDIEEHGTCDFDTFLKFVLEKVDGESGIDSDDRLENTLEEMVDICNLEKFQKVVQEYCETVANEHGRYGPFVAAFNFAFRLLKDVNVEACAYRPPDKMDIHFCRNAEKEIRGVHAGGAGDFHDLTTKRKPDVILTSLAVLKRAFTLTEYEDLLHCVQEQPSENFTWHDVLSAWEFKLVKKTLSLPVPVEYGVPLKTRYDTMGIKQETKTREVKDSAVRPPRANQPRKTRPSRGPNEAVLRTLRSFKQRDAQAPAEGQNQPAVITQETRPAASTAPAQEDFDKDRPPPAIQAALYGAELLSRAPAISHAISVVIFDSVIHVWWYDHEGAIQTTGLDFLSDLPRFLALLFALQRFNVEDWGLISGFDLGGIKALTEGKRRMDPAPTTVTGTRLRKVMVKTASPLYRTLGLKGRGTWVVESACPTLDDALPLNKDSLVTKFSWADCTRIPEAKIIELAIERAHGNPKVTEHLPIVVDEKQFDGCNTADVRRRLGIPLRKRRLGYDGQEVEVYRVLRVITTDRLQPLHKLQGREFLDVWFQCTEVHFLNWNNNIHHKDPSLNNLMYRKMGDKVYGVLNDWDLAVDASQPQTHTGFEVTGTIPFMAIDMLSKEALKGQVRHLYRHDLEAMFYILVWALCCYEDTLRLNPLPELFRSWITGDMEACRASKVNLLMEGWASAPPTASWGDMERAVAITLLIHFRSALLTRGLRQIEQMQRSYGRSRAAQQDEAPPVEVDEPAKVWQEFCALVKQAIVEVVGECTPAAHELPPSIASLFES